MVGLVSPRTISSILQKCAFSSLQISTEQVTVFLHKFICVGKEIFFSF